MSTKNDAVIKELMAKVEQQKAGLGKRAKATLQTNGIFKFNSTSFFNLNTIAEPYRLVEALGFLIAKSEAFKVARLKLGVEAEFKWDDYTVDEWESDFKTRISLIDWDNKKKQLEETQKRLSQLVSEDARTEMELENITKALQG